MLLSVDEIVNFFCYFCGLLYSYFVFFLLQIILSKLIYNSVIKIYKALTECIKKYFVVLFTD